MVVIEFINERRVVQLYKLVVAVKIRQCNKQIEFLIGWEQRCRRMTRGAHRSHGVIHKTRHETPAQRRPEPA